MRILFALALAVASLVPAYSQTGTITCNVNVGVAPTVRLNGTSEPVADIVLVCTSTAASVPVLVNFEVFLNVNLTSRITNTVTLDTEGLLLIDEPLPGVPNTSNGFPYAGQVLGTSGVMAGLPGSGNVYQAKVVSNNAIAWLGVPWVTGGGTRIFRMTNVHANASQLGVPGAIQSFVSIAGPVVPAIVNPTNTVAFAQDGLSFSSAVLVTSPSTLDLTFKELFPSAFKKRIENTLGGPLTAVHQDVPGTVYCTESIFTPQFSPVTPGAIGSASTGTRLLANISAIPPGVFVLIVPNEVTSSSGDLVAHRVLPPFGPHFDGGTVLTFGGNSIAFVTAAHTADLLYEVTAAPPFVGKNGCAALDTIQIAAHAFFPAPLTAAVVTGHLAPEDATPVASPTAPEPRFLP